MAARRQFGGRRSYTSLQTLTEPVLSRPPVVHRFCEVPRSGTLSTSGVSVAAAPLGVGPTILRKALTESRAAWAVLFDARDQLAEGALERFGQAARLAPGVVVVTGDDDEVRRMRKLGHPRLRPGPSPDLWLCIDPDFAVVAVEREAALKQVQPGDSPYTLFLRLSGAASAGHAHVPQVLCHRRRRRTPARPVPPIRRPLTSEPSIEVIVCLRDRPDLLQRCAGSLLGHTEWDRLTLRLVDNASTDPATAAVLARLARDPRVTVESDPREFNFSALNHAATERSEADLLVFLNNDTEVIEPGWVETLAEEAMRPEVGAVAPLLLYPSGRVQHAGVAIGIHGWAGHPFAGLRPEQRTPFGAATDGTRNWLAVTAACMMVARRKYLAVGGFDPAFAVGGGDVDLCLRLTAAGYRSLCVPHARLIHDESASRDPAAVPPGDFEASRRSYGAFRTVGDPFYHPALTLRDTSCRLRGADEPLPRP